MCKPNVERVRAWESRVAILMVKALESLATVETLISDDLNLQGDADFPMCLRRVVRPSQDRAGNSQKVSGPHGCR